MPALKKLSIINLRNVMQADLSLAPRFNIFFGENGSGKSTVLEAVYLLGLAKSFRVNHQKSLIQEGKDKFTVYTSLEEDSATIGISRGLKGSPKVKLSGNKVKSLAQLAEVLPLQLLNSDTYKLLEGSPDYRRQFMDWGVFHVEHQFILQWRKTRRALLNRNSLLKRKASRSEVDPWTVELVSHSLCVDTYRSKYMDMFLPILNDVIDELICIDGLNVVYERGWPKGKTLKNSLEEGYSRDQKYGYTVVGPQRADIKIKICNHNAVDILSRGQQKLLISAFKIAQGRLYQRHSSTKCIYLVDDIASELDLNNKNKIFQLLLKLDVQIFITCVDKESFELCMPSEHFKADENKLFHVKHGKIEEFIGC